MCRLWEVLLFSENNFHHPLPSRNDYLSGLILFVSFSVFLSGFLYLCRSISPRKYSIISSIVVAGILVLPLNQLREYVAQHVLPWSIANSNWYKITPLLAGLILVRFSKFYYGLVFKTASYFFLFPFFIFVKLGIGFLSGAKIESTFTHARLHAVNNNLSNRVVWIIFDELDYRLTFPERPKHVFLPNFDKFSDQSFNFNNALPPANATITSIPSLLDGIAYSFAYPISHQKLMLRSSSSDVAPWGTHSNVFTDVIALGGKSAVVGWYLPYSRIFGDSVQFSHWVSFSPEGFVGTGRNIIGTLKCYLIGLTPVIRKFLHSDNLRLLEKDVDEIIVNPEINLCFIHLPTPHLPSLNRNLGLRYSGIVDGYFGNLTIADRTLGRCLSKIGSCQVFSNTTVIVSSDHPWRVSSLHDGKSDHRVPLLVRFPGQTNSVHSSIRVHTVNTRKLVSEILSAPSVVNYDTANSVFLQFF